ncbi:MAG TPA: Clp protease N-terminal domain-containing protein [Streptosporangiaceae bacterium]|nr:Clp protease N-terminal domain-containing protein [Streptosporangiaceae bacterium]
MLERFTSSARQAVVDAKYEAGRAGQEKVHSEHLLLALFSLPGEAAEAMTAAGLTADTLRARLPRGTHPGPAALDADALASLGIDLDAVRRATDATFGRGALDRVMPPGRRRLPFADDAKRSLAGAARYSIRLGQRSITTGHLLLGVIDQPRNGALSLLADAGIDTAALRSDLLRRMTPAA